MTGSLFPFVRRLVLSHWFHFGDWDLCFFPVSWEFFKVGSGHTGSMLAVCDFFGLCTGWLLTDDFTIFGVVGCVGCFASFFASPLDEDCNPGWGDCGRPLWPSLGVLVCQRW